MTLPKPTIVIFDMDGTTIRHLNPKMLGVIEWFDDMAFWVTKIWDWIFRKWAQGPILSPEDLADPEREVRKAKSLIVHRAIHKLRNKPLDLLVEPCPGIYGVLEFLKQHNVPCALASNGLGKGYGADILRKFSLDIYFPVTVFREDIHKSKPHPEPILLALGRLNLDLKPSDVIWYIGDRHKDVLAAQAAQKNLPCMVVPVACGLNAAVAIIEKGYSPQQIFMNYRDMQTLLSQLFSEHKEKIDSEQDTLKVIKANHM